MNIKDVLDAAYLVQDDCIEHNWDTTDEANWDVLVDNLQKVIDYLEQRKSNEKRYNGSLV